MGSYFVTTTARIWLISGVFLAVTFVNPSIWWLLIPGVVLTLYALELASTKREVFWGAFLVGSFKAAGAISWVWYTYPLTWIDLENGLLQLVCIFLIWITVSLSTGLGLGLALFLYKYFCRDLGPITLFFFPWFWLLGELLGSIFFSIYSSGPGSTINFEFTFGYLGYLVAHLAVLYPIVLNFGVAGLTVIAVAFSTSVYYLFREKNYLRAFPWLFFALFTAVIIVLYLLNPIPIYKVSDKKIVAIETNFSAEFLKLEGSYDTKYQELTDAILTALKLNPDIVFLPEDARYTKAFKSEEDALQFFRTYASTSTSTIVDVARTTDEREETIARAYYYVLSEDLIVTTDKQYFVPIGEFVPYLLSLVLTPVSSHVAVQEFYDDRSYRPGLKTGYEDFPKDLPGMLFCNESSSLIRTRMLAESRESPIILNSISHAWFHEPAILWKQQDAMLRVAAIQNQKVIVVSSNLARSKAYLPDGRIIVPEPKIITRYWKLVAYNL